MFLVSKNHLHWLINPAFSRCWIPDISPIKLDWCLLNSEKGKSSLAPPWFLLGKRKQLRCRSGARLEVPWLPGGGWVVWKGSPPDLPGSSQLLLWLPKLKGLLGLSKALERVSSVPSSAQGSGEMKAFYFLCISIFISIY